MTFAQNYYSEHIQEEIEARFLIPQTLIKNHLSGYRQLKIRQFYISEEKQSGIIQQVTQSYPGIRPMLLSGLNTARLRAQQPKGLQASYFIQFKTRKKQLTQTEISLPLSWPIFKNLISKADDGYIAKNRLIKSVDCKIAGKYEKIEVNVDFITALGLGKNRMIGGSLPEFLEHFAIAEVELPNESAYQDLKSRQWGELKFLNQAINLQDLKNKSAENLSFRTLPKGKENRAEIQKISELVGQAA